MARGALHLFEAGAVVEGTGNERRPHRVRREAAVQADLIHILAHDSVDHVWIEVSAQTLDLPAVPDRPEEGTLLVVPEVRGVTVGVEVLFERVVAGYVVALAALLVQP